ncbi:putative bifunctional diguanylate cyclase/phosphodiesterase [Amaricoccus solimangrovi]|uniref:GGDEF domain-containing protein n=1 Tax=Amaricoccus solimangrovi TaxID=2589815 RepID=A0A501WQ48_9RHOB|nr:bifunctional diguanylate cyclase/phosphodiesterase [Amaricoccus solimangrovi]TPE50455.1 GGDEF domain-containing protein [Amaricoccus solimangrovi]
MENEPDIPVPPDPRALFRRVLGATVGALGVIALTLAIGARAPLAGQAGARRALEAARAETETAHALLGEIATPVPFGHRGGLDARVAALRAAGLLSETAAGGFFAMSHDLTDRPEARARLGALLTTAVLPETDRRAREALAGLAAAEARWARLLLLLAGGGALAAGGLLLFVALPAGRRIRAWAARAGEAERENRFRLLHDPVTGMPNGTFLRAHLGRLVAGADREATQTAVLRLDIDRFGMLRDTLGPRTSDEILRMVARRLRNTLRAGDFAAHMGHDDFVLVASGLADAGAAAAIAARTQAALSKPFAIRGGTQRIATSIGVTLVSDDAPDTERVLANAEIALAAAEAANGACVVRYFRDELRVEVERREALFTELLAGLGRGELVPYFQPQICLRTGALAGFEALVRWRHPRRGVLAPGAFLDFAEDADLTERIGEAVLGQSLRAIRAWDRAKLDVPRVGVNFAAKQLRDPALIEKIKWEVERADIDPSRLAIEVLETVMIRGDADMVARNLRGLASAGFHIELDDFGTGHASLANLRRLMVNRIKIDRSFVDGIETTPEQREITASMIAMAGALGIGTLAEGVESRAAAEVLRELGCDLAQGYLIAKPMPLGETFDWLRAFEAAGKGGACRVAAGPNTP